MVYLNRIYTKTGDQGETMLGSGEMVPKTSLRIEAYGTVDELNACLGVITSLKDELDASTREQILSIQNDLFDLGADLCIPEGTETPSEPLRITESQVTALEQWIDQLNDDLEPLESFILPGGTSTAAQLHVARTVCRRAERLVFALMEQETINSQVSIYLNRLSDLLFVMARAANDHGKLDVLWKPGANRG